MEFSNTLLLSLTNLVGGVGTTKYAYTAGNGLLTEGDPFTSDTVTDTQNNRERRRRCCCAEIVYRTTSGAKASITNTSFSGCNPWRKTYTDGSRFDHNQKLKERNGNEKNNPRVLGHSGRAKPVRTRNGRVPQLQQPRHFPRLG